MARSSLSDGGADQVSETGGKRVFAERRDWVTAYKAAREGLAPARSESSRFVHAFAVIHFANRLSMVNQGSRPIDALNLLEALLGEQEHEEAHLRGNVMSIGQPRPDRLFPPSRSPGEQGPQSTAPPTFS